MWGNWQQARFPHKDSPAPVASPKIRLASFAKIPLPGFAPGGSVSGGRSGTQLFAPRKIHFYKYLRGAFAPLGRVQRGRMLRKLVKAYYVNPNASGMVLGNMGLLVMPQCMGGATRPTNSMYGEVLILTHTTWCNLMAFVLIPRGTFTYKKKKCRASRGISHIK